MFEKFFGDKKEEVIEQEKEIAQSHRDTVRTRERLKGKIIILKEDEGWGFLACRDIPFTRIFFHWTALYQDTLNFTHLRKGMWVEFEPLEIEGRGIRAIKIRVEGY